MKRFAKIWGGIALILFLLFLIFSTLIGGDAIHGYIENGDYFVSGLSDPIEVSQTIWILNYISGIGGLGSIGIFILLHFIIKIRNT